MPAFAGPASALTASKATDVCSSNANPCNVTTVVEVVPGSTLDFGTRAVNVTGSGQFQFGSDSGSILCGAFSASTANAAMIVRGPLSSGSTAGGTVTLKARRRCSATSPVVACLGHDDCDLGSCGTRRCSGNSTRVCLSDASCQLGPCGANKRCTASANSVRCTTNADCDFGTCPAQLTCADRGDDPQVCTSNADCFFGTCSIGTAGIALGGAISGSAQFPGAVTLRAADSVAITKTVTMSGTTAQSDGGTVVLDSRFGSVNVTAKIAVTSGAQGGGGSVQVSAGVDATIAEEVNASGGDSDGGLIQVDAGRDVAIARSLVASATGGAGSGGEVVLEAGRDVSVTGLSSLSRTTIEVNGSTDIASNAGDGGLVDLYAGRGFSADANTRMLARGSAPDGQGGEVFLASEATVVLRGDLVAKADGGGGAGGTAEISSEGPMTAGATSVFDLTGGTSGGGDLIFLSAANTDFAGTASVGASGGGLAGNVQMEVDGDVQFSGVFGAFSGAGGSLAVDACRIRLASGGKLESRTTNGANSLLARESMQLLAGSSLSAGTSGSNTLVYRTADKPPVLQGTIVPAPKKVVLDGLQGCPVCGNGEVDDGETCDDGNTLGGDGCSNDCQNEKCLAQTVSPGYPTVSLCEDGDPCTADFCNAAQNGGTCRHPAKNCSDEFSCTVDSCVAGVCQHVASDAACNDGNPCTDDFCAVQTGCFTTANNAACDDGLACTDGDQCVAKTCQGTPIGGCGFCGDGEVQQPEQCDDGNATFVNGEYCAAGCVLVPCGKPTNSSGTLPKASDALFTLRAAVGQVTCSRRVCDVDNSGKIVSSDALRVLRAAVGQSVTLQCPTG